jgi:microcystin-dependent protein
MADPAPYTISYSFTGFQNNAPASPLPATRLDTELSNIAAAIADLVTSIKTVRRADGALPNGIVTYESLALGLQLTFDPTNGDLVAAAVTGTAADRAAAALSAAASAVSATDADAARVLAEAAADSVNLNAYLSKAGNLDGLGSAATARGNLELGGAALLDAGTGVGNLLQFAETAKLPALDGSGLTGIDTLPVGTTIYVNGTTAPAGTIKENGALLTRAAFPRLWAFAQASGNLASEAVWTATNGGSFSTGDLATTFRIPDSRGEFIRGLDDGRGVDTGRTLGVNQTDDLKSHAHTFSAGQSVGNGQPGSDTGTLLSVSLFTTNNTGGTETRPRNISKLACIKY